jgi:hypothetical protein
MTLRTNRNKIEWRCIVKYQYDAFHNSFNTEEPFTSTHLLFVPHKEWKGWFQICDVIRDAVLHACWVDYTYQVRYQPRWVLSLLLTTSKECQLTHTPTLRCCVVVGVCVCVYHLLLAMQAVGVVARFYTIENDKPTYLRRSTDRGEREWAMDIYGFCHTPAKGVCVLCRKIVGEETDFCWNQNMFPLCTEVVVRQLVYSFSSEDNGWYLLYAAFPKYRTRENGTLPVIRIKKVNLIQLTLPILGALDKICIHRNILWCCVECGHYVLLSG